MECLCAAYQAVATYVSPLCSLPFFFSLYFFSVSFLDMEWFSNEKLAATTTAPATTALPAPTATPPTTAATSPTLPPRRSPPPRPPRPPTAPLRPTASPPTSTRLLPRAPAASRLVAAPRPPAARRRRRRTRLAAWPSLSAFSPCCKGVSFRMEKSRECVILRGLGCFVIKRGYIFQSSN